MPSFGQDPAQRQSAFHAAVNAERDRRIASGFYFGPHRFDWDEDTKSRVTGKAALAGFAIASGAAPGDLRWDGSGADFGWILADNTVLPLDAHGMFAVAIAASLHEQDHVFAARDIKKFSALTVDFSNDDLWPMVAP